MRGRDRAESRGRSHRDHRHARASPDMVWMAPEEVPWVSRAASKLLMAAA